MELFHEGVMSKEARASYGDLTGSMFGANVAPPASGLRTPKSKGADVQPTKAGLAPPLGIKMAQARRNARMSGGPAAQIPDDYVPGTTREISGIEEALAPKMSAAQVLEQEALKLLGMDKTRSIVMGAAPVSAPQPAVQAAKQEEKAPAIAATTSDAKSVQIGDKTAASAPAVKTAAESWAEELLKAGPVHTAKILLRNMKDSWLRWEPETIWREILLRTGIEVPQQTRNAILAIRLVIATNRFHGEWEVFEKVIVALNGRNPIFGVMQHVTPEDIARAMTWAERLNKQPYSAEVLAYVAAICHQDGLICLPEALSQAQPYLDKLSKDPGLCEQVSARWKAVKDAPDFSKLDFGGEVTPVTVQLTRMASVADAAKRPLLAGAAS